MRCLPLAAMLLASAASASAQGALSSDEALVAYCHGAWSAQSLAIEQLIEGPADRPARQPNAKR